MESVTGALVLFSILFPSKLWYAPDQDIHVQLRDAPADTTLVLMDSQGKLLVPQVPVEFSADRVCDITRYWRELQIAGTYLLLAVPGDRSLERFLGTPLVIQVRADTRPQAPPGPMVIKIEPLSYAVLSTDKGDMTAVFYYDVAPYTVANFVKLAQGGYYDGLLFHRVLPNALIQTGDPRGDGTGGPGYHVEGEFSSRKHEPGVLSMSRLNDPIESQGPMPRAEFANSGGSQFFICLDYQKTMQFDGRYSAFGKVVRGLEVAKEIGRVEVDPKHQRPVEAPRIRSVRVMPVTRENNPYADLAIAPLPALTEPGPAVDQPLPVPVR
jgi:peptidyl-prolyl cis-trans isomerase B (cyclophilin B)